MQALAYELADKVSAMYSSEIVQQKTFSMEATEFREFLAAELEAVLLGRSSKPRGRQTTPGPRQQREGGRDGESDHITHDAAKRLLEAAPAEVKREYVRCREVERMTPGKALEAALRMLATMQEAAAFAQVGS